MADTVSTSNILGVGLEYMDTETLKAKTTYLKIPNPKANLTETQIKNAVSNLISGENPILLTTQGEPFDSATAITTAYTESQEVIEIDIE